MYYILLKAINGGCRFSALGKRIPPERFTYYCRIAAKIKSPIGELIRVNKEDALALTEVRAEKLLDILRKANPQFLFKKKKVA